MKKIKTWIFLLAVVCVAGLAGCTKSNIVTPNESAGADVIKPDTHIYFDIVLDEEDLQASVEDLYLDEGDYPMAAALDFALHLDEEYIDVNVAVKDGTSMEDAAYYVETVLKGINDEVCVQDFSYGESDTDTFGGLYQDNVTNLKVYFESDYEADGEPFFETQIGMDEYVEFDFSDLEREDEQPA
ncbi:MAG: hypothetical protein LUE86_12540 [Clostridiales bacterium]|nr:hypothetical protein [Clostridiales bacterium]